MSNYDIHKPSEYANTQHRTSLLDISQHSKQVHVKIYPEDNPAESTSHRNIPIIQAYLSEQQILISTFPGRAVVRKESISLLPPRHLHRISGVLALQATGTVMRTGKAAHKLGRSAVHSKYGISVI